MWAIAGAGVWRREIGLERTRSCPAARSFARGLSLSVSEGVAGRGYGVYVAVYVAADQVVLYILCDVDASWLALCWRRGRSGYPYQSLASTLLYVLPWAIVRRVGDLDEGNAWTRYSLVLVGVV